MTSRAVCQTIFIAGMLLASSTFAGTDVIKCTGEDGRITLTDQPCSGEAEQVVMAGDDATADEALPTARGRADRYQLNALPPAPRLRALSQLQAPGRALARDVATLKQARRASLLLDSTMASMRQQGLASK